MSAPSEIRTASIATKSTRQRWTVPAGLLFLGALIAIGVLPRIERRREAEYVAHATETSVATVSAVRATMAPPTSELLLPGNTEPITVAAIYARANGYVRQRFVD